MKANLLISPKRLRRQEDKPHSEHFMIKEFRTLARSGQTLELAMALVLGTSIYYSMIDFVDNVLLPPFGFIWGGRAVSSLFINLTPGKRVPGGPIDSIEKAHFAGAAIIAYGAVITDVIHCLIAFMLMLFVLRWVNRARGPVEDAELGLAAPHPREPM